MPEAAGLRAARRGHAARSAPCPARARCSTRSPRWARPARARRAARRDGRRDRLARPAARRADGRRGDERRDRAAHRPLGRPARRRPARRADRPDAGGGGASLAGLLAGVDADDPGVVEIVAAPIEAYAGLVQELVVRRRPRRGRSRRRPSCMPTSRPLSAELTVATTGLQESALPPCARSSRASGRDRPGGRAAVAGRRTADADRRVGLARRTAADGRRRRGADGDQRAVRPAARSRCSRRSARSTTRSRRSSPRSTLPSSRSATRCTRSTWRPCTRRCRR